MKRMKRTLAAVLALAVVFLFSGCGQLRISTEIATVNGSVITKGEFNYYLENVKAQMQQEAGEAGTKEDYWETAEIDGKKAAEVAKEKAMDEAIRVEIGAIKAREAGLTLDNETLRSINATVDPQSRSQEEQVEAIYKETGLNDQTLKSMLEKSYLASLYQDKVTSENESLTVNEEEIKAKFVSDYALVKHVLLSNQKEVPAEETEASASASPSAQADASASADPAASTEPHTVQVAMTDEELAELKTKAEDIVARARAGEDFDQLVAEYGEDPGMESSPEGYTVYKGSGMVAPFEEAALALKVGEVSDVVESDFGYHIIKRFDNSNDTETYDQHKATIESTLKQDKYNAYIDGLRGSMTINIKQNIVDGIKVKPVPTQAPTATGASSSVPVQ